MGPVALSRDYLQSQEMVAEMVFYFLLPEVEKETIREKGTYTCTVTCTCTFL